MAKVQVPHFDLPFRFETGFGGPRAAVAEQDTTRDVINCVEAVIRYPLGYRLEKPSFGTPDKVFEQMTATMEGFTSIYRGVISRWEPRADALIYASPDEYEQLVARVRIEVREERPGA